METLNILINYNYFYVVLSGVWVMRCEFHFKMDFVKALFIILGTILMFRQGAG